MSTLITRGAATIAPSAVTEYSADREAQNLVHVIPGRADPDITLRPALMRSGTLMLTFTGASAETDSKTADDLHAASTGAFILASTEHPSINMSYVPTGRCTRALDRETRAFWTLSVPFQEVAP